MWFVDDAGGPGLAPRSLANRISSNLHEPTGVAAGSASSVTRAWGKPAAEQRGAPGAASRRHPAPPRRGAKVRLSRAAARSPAEVAQVRSGSTGRAMATVRGHASDCNCGGSPAPRDAPDPRRDPSGATSKVHRGASRRRFPKKTVCAAPERGRETSSLPSAERIARARAPPPGTPPAPFLPSAASPVARLATDVSSLPRSPQRRRPPNAGDHPTPSESSGRVPPRSAVTEQLTHSH